MSGARNANNDSSFSSDEESGEEKVVQRESSRKSSLGNFGGKLGRKISGEGLLSLEADTISWPEYFALTWRELIIGSTMNVLAVLAPFALLAQHYNWGEGVKFTCALVALVPFAERVSFVTEDVAKYTNDTLGGLLNATFGNITELIVCILALRAGRLRIVQVSMLGSVFSNLLLVLGSAFLIGGFRHTQQNFKQVVSVTNSMLLMLGVIGLSLPTLLDVLTIGSAGHHPSLVAAAPVGNASSTNAGYEVEEALGGSSPVWLSRVIASGMLIIYGLFLVFQLKTHVSLFNGDEGDDDEEPGILGFWGGVFWLSVITLFITLLSDMIVDSIEGAAEDLKVPTLFISGILLPIVGNAAEHAAAITFAWRNKMEISLGSSIGSAVQISVFVIPLCVLIGWGFGHEMSLNFHPFETACLLLTVVCVAIVVGDGRSHWLKGAVLLMTYVMIAASFWAEAEPANMNE